MVAVAGFVWTGFCFYKWSLCRLPSGLPLSGRHAGGPRPDRSDAPITAAKILRASPVALVMLPPARAHVAQQIGIGTLLEKGLKAHHVIGHRRILGSRGRLATKTSPKIRDDHRCG